MKFYSLPLRIKKPVDKAWEGWYIKSPPSAEAAVGGIPQGTEKSPENPENRKKRVDKREAA